MIISFIIIIINITGEISVWGKENVYMFASQGISIYNIITPTHYKFTKYAL